MDSAKNYIDINRISWNNKTEIHLQSDFYNHEGFLKGESSLKEIELKLLENVRGKKILHLQCHFGQDSISLCRLGASVTGVDFSEKAIDIAKETAIQTQADATFICCNIYDLLEHHNETYDIVYTSYGTIGWLPNLDKWANIISHFLKPQGKLVFVEFHPVVWMFDDDFKTIGYRYFNSGAIVETEHGTYADKTALITQQYVMWNHSISEVLNSLIKHHLVIDSFDEFDFSPFNCFSETIEYESGKFRIKHLDNKIPMVFALTAIKKIPLN